MERGLFIVFEGIDGSGKTTQALLLTDWLLQRGFEVKLTEEPTRDLTTGFLVKLALKSKETLPPEAYLVLFLVDRLAHIRNLILPSLENGKIVISDRYHYSTLAYQGSALPREKIDTLTELILGELVRPDVVFFIDVSPETALRRLQTRDKRGEEVFEKESFLRKVREAYLNLAKEFGFYIIDGERDPMEIQDEIRGVVEEKLTG